ncbi:MAG: LysR family transcriptional regulator [Myxococcota bacterium]|nr:LysR family transcriptional regulator [Myxococcota bacterium]
MKVMHLAALDLNLLLALDRLLAHRSVTAAAAELGVTQPAMSRTLGRLRDALDDPLFVREGRALVPTPRALALTPRVTEAVRAAAAVFAPDAPFDPARERGVFTLAMGEETQRALAPAIVRRVWEEAPGLDLRFRALTVESVEEARRGEVDLSIAPDLAALPRSAGGGVELSELVQRPLYERRWVVCSSTDRPRRRLSLKTYARLAHVVPGPDASGRGFIDDYLESHGLSRRVAASVATFDAAASLVAGTELIATLPDDVVRTSPHALVLASPPVPIPVVSMLLLWMPRDTTDPRHRFVRGRVAEAVQATLTGP